jgi:hypothetical protein
MKMKRSNRTSNNNIFGEDAMANNNRIERGNRSDGVEDEGKKNELMIRLEDVIVVSEFL